MAKVMYSAVGSCSPKILRYYHTRTKKLQKLHPLLEQYSSL